MNELWSHDGHISLIIRASRPDTFNVLNWPAHIQGAAAAFQLRVHAFAVIEPAALARLSAATAGSAAAADVVAAVKCASLPSLQVSPPSSAEAACQRT
jgi:hypothetical protein